MQCRQLISFFLLAAVCALYVEGVPVYDKYRKQGSSASKKTTPASPSPTKKASPSIIPNKFASSSSSTRPSSSPSVIPNKFASSSSSTRPSPSPSPSPSVKSTPSFNPAHPIQANPTNKATTVNKFAKTSSTGTGSGSASGSKSPTSQSPGSKSYFGYLSDATSKVSSGVGSGLSSGASLVGSGLSSGASALGSLGGGVSSTLSSIASGLGSDYTIGKLANALSAVSPETLSKALDLAGLPKSLADKVDIVNVVGKLISNQANPMSGMNFETATIFLEKFGGMVPQLQTTINAVKTVNFVMQKIRSMQNDDQQFEPSKVMLEAADLYFKDVDPTYKRKLIDMAPLVSKAASGDTDAAMKIAAGLIDRNTALEALKAVGFKSQVQLIQGVINQASDYANIIKFTADSAKVIQGK